MFLTSFFGCQIPVFCVLCVFNIVVLAAKSLSSVYCVFLTSLFWLPNPCLPCIGCPSTRKTGIQMRFTIVCIYSGKYEDMTTKPSECVAPKSVVRVSGFTLNDTCKSVYTDLTDPTTIRLKDEIEDETFRVMKPKLSNLKVNKYTRNKIKRDKMKNLSIYHALWYDSSHEWSSIPFMHSEKTPNPEFLLLQQ